MGSNTTRIFSSAPLAKAGVHVLNVLDDHTVVLGIGYGIVDKTRSAFSATRYLRELNRLADYLKRVGVSSLSEMSPQLLSSFVVDTAPKFAPNTRRDLCGVIRTFLRYLHRERILDEDLSVTFEIPKLFRLSNVPRSITWGEMRELLRS